MILQVQTELMDSRAREISSERLLKQMNFDDVEDIPHTGRLFSYQPLVVSADSVFPVLKQRFPSNRRFPHIAPLLPDIRNCEEVYRCYLCEFAAKQQWKIAQHWIRVHLAQRPYLCPYCERTFVTSWRAAVHVEHKHPGAVVAVRFSKSKDIARRLRYDLDFAGDNLSDEIDTKGTIRYRSNNDLLKFSCKKCAYIGGSKNELARHARTAHPRILPYVCKYCIGSPMGFTSFVGTLQLNEHIRLKHPEKIQSNTVVRVNGLEPNSERLPKLNAYVGINYFFVLFH